MSNKWILENSNFIARGEIDGKESSVDLVASDWKTACMKASRKLGTINVPWKFYNIRVTNNEYLKYRMRKQGPDVIVVYCSDHIEDNEHPSLFSLQNNGTEEYIDPTNWQHFQ